MERIESRLNTAGAEYKENRRQMEAAVAKLRAEIERIRLGGPEESRRRHV